MTRNISLLQNNIGINQGNNDATQINNNHHTNIGEYVQEKENYPSISFIILISLIFGILSLNHGLYYGVLLITVAISPGVLIIYQFKKQIIQGEISIKTITDLFTFGAIISVSTTLILEGLFFSWIFNIKNDHYNYINKYGCNIGFPLYIFIIILKYIISIGIVEEGCKLLGLLTIKPYIQDINYRESFTSHYVKSNIGYVLGGISTSLGFAIIENIAYLSNSMENIIIMFLVGIARAIISIPFHIFASGYTSIQLSKQTFRENHHHLNDDHISFKKVITKLLTLLPAGVLHGIYDSSLIIIVIISQDHSDDLGSEFNPIGEIKTCPKLFTKIYKLATLNPFSFKIRNLIGSIHRQTLVQNPLIKCFSPLSYNLITLGFFLISVFSYFACLFLFLHNWIHLERRTSSRRIMAEAGNRIRTGAGEVELVGEYGQV
ncbi:uncharacterized protein cubi_00711 [Cryptosporidium ubiquitum]|uniref:Protease n=1 Tax=Cryptosporidium ubiquitum TaxID=857276 RepID=A0A1J4MD44_9CRYT|nr:uncharacterized protein cubi_00711 [Cryptosporidium ubiquitum]OII71903.1 hypothetical protein cubi_00711 [Cryptosporidium ubiquitum]